MIYNDWYLIELSWSIAILGTIELCCLMLDWIVRNRTVWSFNYVYQQNVFSNHILDLYVQTGFGNK